MVPILFQIGDFVFHTYGLLIAVGVFIGIKITIGLACQEGFVREIVEESFHQLLFYFVIGGILGARIFYVLIYWQEFSGNFAGIFKIWQGGLVSYGGLMGAMFGFFFWQKRNRNYPWRKMLDWLSPSLAFGQAFGRLGCFFAGCCYGNTTEKPWGIVFNDPQSLAPLGISLHPTQLYEFVFLIFLGFFLLWRNARKKLSLARVDGLLFADYLAIYSFGRFAIEFFRGGELKVWLLTSGQMMSILVFALSIFFRMVLTKKNNSANLI